MGRALWLTLCAVARARREYPDAVSAWIQPLAQINPIAHYHAERMLREAGDD